MATLNNVRNKFNGNSVEWLKLQLETLGWTSKDLARRINPRNQYLYKTINRILERQVNKPQLTTLVDIANVLRNEELITGTLTPIDEERLAQKWLVYTISREINQIVSRPSQRTTLWILGSYKGMSVREKKIAKSIINSLPAKIIEAKIRVVVGDSTMLREFIHICRDIHNQSDIASPNPVMVFGRLRKRDLRGLFEDTINCVPDLGSLIGGNIEKGRVKEEYDGAIKADIPIICIASTGGVARQVRSVAERASHLLGILDQRGDNVDIGDLTVVIWAAIMIYVKH